MTEKHTSRCTSFDGTRLHVETRGPVGAPPVVMVHGLGLSTSSWGRVPELLARELRVTLYDLRGHGESGRPPEGDYDLFAHAGDLHRVIEASVPDGERAVLVGNSFGGGVILAYAKRHGSGRVAGAAFAGSGGSEVTLPGLPRTRTPRAVRGPAGAAWTAALRALAGASHKVRPVAPVARWFVRRAAFEPSAPTEAVDRVRQDFMRTPAETLTRTARASTSYDPVLWAGRLGAPAVVLHGGRDPEVGDANAFRLLDALPTARLVHVPGAGHMLPLTRPEVVAEHVVRLAARPAGGASG